MALDDRPPGCACFSSTSRGKDRSNEVTGADAAAVACSAIGLTAFRLLPLH
jgi:hypothetical protein